MTTVALTLPAGPSVTARGALAIFNAGLFTVWFVRVMLPALLSVRQKEVWVLYGTVTSVVAAQVPLVMPTVRVSTVCGCTTSTVAGLLCAWNASVPSGRYQVAMPYDDVRSVAATTSNTWRRVAPAGMLPALGSGYQS